MAKMMTRLGLQALPGLLGHPLKLPCINFTILARNNFLDCFVDQPLLFHPFLFFDSLLFFIHSLPTYKNIVKFVSFALISMLGLTWHFYGAK